VSASLPSLSSFETENYYEIQSAAHAIKVYLEVILFNFNHYKMAVIISERDKKGFMAC
jgi:hypothetical protein